MTDLTEATVREALRSVQEPELGGDLISRGMVKTVGIDDHHVALTIELTTPACPLKDEIETDIRSALTPLGAQSVAVEWTSVVRRAAPAPPSDSPRTSGAGSHQRPGSNQNPSRRGRVPSRG